MKLLDRPEHYFMLNPIGRQLLDQRKMFLSRRAISSFGGYAGQQLRRLENALAHDAYPAQAKERHIMGSCENAMYSFPERYRTFDPAQIKLSVGEARGQPQVLADINMERVPLREFTGMMGELVEITRNYDKIHHRNKKKDDAHLNKHAMHLVRLYLMCLDILEKEEILTYRETDHDLLMDIRWDVCTSALPEKTERCFAGQRIIATGLKHGTVTVLVESEPFEITTYRTEGPYSDSRRPDFVRFVTDLEQDLARRDFTMNAVAIDLQGNLRDPFGGAGDIKAGLIRCAGDPDRRFQGDGLRVMRALRFAAVFGYEIEKQTAQAVHENRAMLDRVAAERISAELCKLLVGKDAGNILRQYPNVFCQFWPELEPLVTLEQNNPWHCWGGWEHTIHALEAAPADVTLRLAMLLHDIGKPACKSTDEQGIDHFYGHPAVSAQLADQMLRALKFDNKTRERVVLLVERHDAQLPPRSQVIRRWLGRLGPETFFQLLEVKRADNMGQTPEKVKDRLAELDEIKAKAEQILAERQCLTLKDLAVNGRDVIAAGIEPGPEVGRVLEGLLEQVLGGEISNERKTLLKYVYRKDEDGFG